jgi:hypothetical protein
LSGFRKGLIIVTLKKGADAAAFRAEVAAKGWTITRSLMRDVLHFVSVPVGTETEACAAAKGIAGVEGAELDAQHTLSSDGDDI